MTSRWYRDFLFVSQNLDHFLWATILTLNVRVAALVAWQHVTTERDFVWNLPLILHCAMSLHFFIIAGLLLQPVNKGSLYDGGCIRAWSMIAVNGVSCSIVVSGFIVAAVPVQPLAG